MVNEISYKSSQVSSGRSPRRPGSLPVYAFAGLAIILIGEILLFAGVPPIKVWFTPIMWTGYILLMDGLVKRRKQTSLVSSYPVEFFILCLISVVSWTIFEGFNVLLKNWTYVGLPDNMIVRYIGYAWAFATISPGMFLTYEVLDLYVPGTKPDAPARLPNALFWTFVIFGLACLIVPLIWPSTHMTPLVWMSFAFFLDPINGRLGERSFLAEFFTGRLRSMPLMFLAGLVCGILWEFWNYWAGSKWHYDVPYLGHIKVFEMPVLGFLGFLPFTIESYAIYVFIRRLLPIPRQVRYLG